jgi:hypothetical protein
MAGSLQIVQAAAAAAAAAAPVVEVQQPDEAPSVSGDAAKPLVAAFVGGKGLKESDKKMIPPGREVRQSDINATRLGHFLLAQQAQHPQHGSHFFQQQQAAVAVADSAAASI